MDCGKLLLDAVNVALKMFIIHFRKKLFFYVTQYGSPIVNETEHRYHFIKTQKEMSLFYLNALQFDETELCLRTCRNCDYSEVIDGSELDMEYTENRLSG